MLGCLLFFAWTSRHWPLVGDATLIDYLVLLVEHGMAPYREIVDAQMPGTYLADWLALHLFGTGAGGLRLLDAALLLASLGAMVVIAWPYDRYAGFLAGGLFALFHGRDGVPQAAQRDLVVAVLLLFAAAAAFQATRRLQAWWMAPAAFSAIAAATIKPTALLAGAALLLPVLVQIFRLPHRPPHRPPHRWVQALLFTTAGALLPVTAVAIFLAEEHATGAFVYDLRFCWPYYATLGRRPLGYLLLHSVSPMLSLLGIGLLLAALRSSRRIRRPRTASDPVPLPRGDTHEWIALYAAAGMSLVSYLLQGKGYPYHRYPLLAFLLLLLITHFTVAVRRPDVGGLATAVRWTGLLGLLLAGLFLAPVSAVKISHFDWRNDEYFDQLHQDMDRLGGPALSTHVQCLDTYAGCINALYRMDLVQSTGFTADLFLWGPPPGEGALPAAIAAMRQTFWSELQQNPPSVFIVTQQVFQGGQADPDSYAKLQRWPAFAAYLNAGYHLVAERTFPHPVRWSSREDHPPGYRVYARNQP